MTELERLFEDREFSIRQDASMMEEYISFLEQIKKIQAENPSRELEEYGDLLMELSRLENKAFFMAGFKLAVNLYREASF